MKEQRGVKTYKEILSQGEVWESTLKNAHNQRNNVSEWINQKHDQVIFTGCGSTYYLSLSAAKHWQRITGQNAIALPGSEIWLYPEVSLVAKEPLLAAVSRSGETTETINAIEKYNSLYSKKWLTVSCYADSQMALEAPVKLLTTGAEEDSVAQTRSFSSMFILTQYLANIAAKNNKQIEELQYLPDIFKKLIDRYESTAKNIADNDQYQHFVFLGSGLNYGLASEVMLKMKEMSISVSEVFHFMEFRHGPMSMITPNSLVIGLISDTGKEEEKKVLNDMKQLGATTMALIENAKGDEADHIIELESKVSELSRGALYLPVLQLIAFYRSMSKGLNPDRPTNLEAVVHL